MVSVYSKRTIDETGPAKAAPTETQRVYEALKRALLAGEFAPGEALQEGRLAAQFGASRTPVREALTRLEADSLLTIVPRRGAFVRQLTARDFLEVNELRLMLEPVTARLAARVVSDEAVAELQELHAAIARDRPTERDFAALLDLDRRMHTLISEATGNARLAKLIQSLNDMMQIVRQQDLRRRHQEMHDSIGEILRFLRNRDGDAVEIAMRRHIGDFSGALLGLVGTFGVGQPRD
jgi:DNA-binding GntR family transcriptional regulator